MTAGLVTADAACGVSAVLVEARATTRRVARTFSLACRLLPRDVRDDVYLLYLVFRTLDDLVDDGRPDAAERVGGGRGVGRRASRRRRRPEIDDPRGPRARGTTCRATRCSTSAPGMREDLEGAVYETEADVDRYCYRVAGTVGLVMAVVLGAARLDRARPAAAALGMAMQRTNILRDIDEDAANGRVYFARETLERHGGARAGPPRARCCATRSAAPTRSTSRASRASASCAAAAARSPPRRACTASCCGGSRREGYGARPGRAVVPRRRKLTIAARAAWRA